MASEALNEAREKLHAALQEMSDAIAPRVCEHGDWVEGDSCEYEETQPVDGPVMLAEFTLVMMWTKMDDGESFLGIHTPPKQPLTHTNGLLHTALYEM